MSYYINGLSIVGFFSHEILFITENEKRKIILKTHFIAGIYIINLKLLMLAKDFFSNEVFGNTNFHVLI